MKRNGGNFAHKPGLPSKLIFDIWLPFRTDWAAGIEIMSGFKVLSGSQQVASHLQELLAYGRWHGTMPGRTRLAAELGVSGKLVDAALAELESEGILEAAGPRRQRRIRVPVQGAIHKSLRVAILLNEAVDMRLDYMLELQHELAKSGHSVVRPAKTMVELGMDVRRIARMVVQAEADAWVVTAGSREVLEWFSSRSFPAFALFGRRNDLPIAAVGPDKRPVIADAVRELVKQGHRRIVLMARPRRRLPEPGSAEQAFLDELAVQGLPVSDYNLPAWEETPRGFHSRLDTLFQVTPPTALIIDEVPLFTATQQFLAQRRMRVPQNVSLICTDYDSSFEWCEPPISHFRWDSQPVLRRIVRWAENTSRGKKDLRQTLTPAEFVTGGTIGPAKA